MKRFLIISLLSLSCVAHAQERLNPGQSFLGLGRYPKFVRHVFADAYRADVVLRVLMLPSFVREEMAGIRRSKQGYEAFSIMPSSSVWDTYNVYQIESGEVRRLNESGKRIPPEINEELRALKKQAPSDYRQIKTRIWSMPISVDLAERLMRIWQKMLLDARAGEDKRLGVDGETFEFAMPMRGRGVVSAEVWSPEEGSKTAALVNIGHALSEYAKGRMDAQKFVGTFRPLER